MKIITEKELSESKPKKPNLFLLKKFFLITTYSLLVSFIASFVVWFIVEVFLNQHGFDNNFLTIFLLSFFLTFTMQILVSGGACSLLFPL